MGRSRLTPRDRTRGEAAGAAEVTRRFDGWPLEADQRAYLAFHAERYAFALGLVRRLASSIAAPRLLDVGPSFQTHLFRTMLDGGEVVTLGDAHSGNHPDFRCDMIYDLNDCSAPPAADAVGRFDIVTMLEVIEHLHVAPERALAFLAKFLKPGGRLVVQTPNAVRLPNRIAMLGGRNPFEMLREPTAPPGHFREYTLAELRRLGAHAGLAVVEERSRSYWRNKRSAAVALYRAAAPLMPATWRQGITMVFEAG